ncbi:MAG: apolipoprotein N-acyltransferase [Lautropia sp.]|nr:apolipoprotein N-acyltransferase [Lautropia sp.]
MTAAPSFPSASTTPSEQRPHMPWWWIPLALLLGVAHAFSFAPFGNGWLQLLVLGAFMLMLFAGVERRLPASRHMLLGLLFGIGWFSAGVGWVYVSMHDHGGMPAPLAGTAVLLFAGYLGLYPALAGSLIGRFSHPRQPGSFVLVAAGSLTLGELARGWVLTGFPWLGIGYAQTDTPLAGFAPVAGVYAVTLVTVLCAVAFALACRLRQPRWLLLPAALLAAGAGLQHVSWSQPTGQPIRVSLLQGNVPQQLKFDPAFAAKARQGYMRMIENAPADLVVLPETAWTLPWQRTEIDLQGRMRHFLNRTGSAVALGMPRVIAPPDTASGQPQTLAWANSVLLLDRDNIGPDQAPPPVYDKHHLVPFGEFVPPGARWFVDLMNIPLGDMARGSTTQPSMPVRGQHIGFNICYEDIFGEELLPALHDAPERPGATILANVTNLGWFGRSHALDQHLQIARMRALETARPMIRATNTGTTAVIDPHGQVLSQLPHHEEATLQAEVQGYDGLTPYARAGGNWPVLIMALLLMLIGSGMRQHRAERYRPA